MEADVISQEPPAVDPSIEADLIPQGQPALDPSMEANFVPQEVPAQEQQRPPLVANPQPLQVRNWNTIEWSIPQGRQKVYPYDDANVGIKPEISGLHAMAEPGEYFELFLTHDVLKLMVDQKNMYANQQLTTNSDVGPKSRKHSWEPTNIPEMKKFIALLGWMGLVNVNTTENY